MKIQIDLETCMNSGQCEHLQPELFSLDDEDVPQILVSGALTEEQIAGAREAVDRCPSQSISLGE